MFILKDNIRTISKNKILRCFISRNFNFHTINRDSNTIIINHKNFRNKQEFFPKLNGLRNIRTTVDNKRSLQYPPYSHYERFDNAIPFYQKRNFWLWTSGLGGLSGIYYVSHLETVPISNRRRFMDVTPKQEELMAQQAFKQVKSHYRNKILHPSDPLVRAVKKVAARIIKVSGMQDLDWEVFVIESSERNAFVLPGGKIFVFTGILDITKNENGLAAVLGHEVRFKNIYSKVGHQIARHSAEKLSFFKIVMLGQIFLSLLIDPGFIGSLLFKFAIFLPFSRKCEIEADYIGLLLMAQACFDPREAIKMWERMEQVSKGIPQFLSTHPNHTARIQKIEKWMPEALHKRELSDCEQLYEGFRDYVNRYGPQWVRF
ncbi:9376_t:CDS:2 [Diversispora eburnea]|uniref:9376_t:CDS:1 n=1 Tax=Diversispora eburnea TaxID=1213867 RepID=A0A9N8V3G7_9GLOM|nr:9376_t:CDS:2 [Diversispora eburnea]